MSMWRGKLAWLQGCALVALAGCSGNDDRQSLREALARLPQDTSTAVEEVQETPVPVDSSSFAPQTLPDSVGFLDAAPPAPIEPDTHPGPLRPGPPIDTRPWIPAPGPAPAPIDWTDEPRVESGDGSAMAVLESVRTARNDGYDRVVFEFEEGRSPGFRVEYVDLPVRQCGSGQPVPLRGDTWLRVRLEPSQAHDDRGRATVRDRARVTNLPALRELHLICDYEGQVEWVLGMNAATGYRVTRLNSPSRIVVDVNHGREF